MLRMLFENDEIQVNYHEVNSCDTVLIIFNPMEWDDTNSPVWGYSSLIKSGYSILGITSKSKNWYPARGVYESLPSILPILRKYLIRINYGFSMGGYAALRYSKELGASHVLALSPQCSISPKDIGDFDRRYIEHFSASKNIDMKISPVDISGNVYLIYDRNFIPDCKHIDLLDFKNANAIHHINLSLVKHGTMWVVAKSRAIIQLLDIVRQNRDGREMFIFLSKFRSCVVEYYESMIFLASQKNQCGLIDKLFYAAKSKSMNDIGISRIYAELLSKQQRFREAVNVLSDFDNPHAINQAANYMILDKDYVGAINYLVPLVKKSRNILFSRNLAKAYELNNELSKAVEVLSSLELLQTDNPDYLCQFGRLLWLSGQGKKGRELALKASLIKPNEPYFKKVLQRLN